MQPDAMTRTPEFLPHFAYEVRMLAFTARRLSRYPDFGSMSPGHPDKQEHDAMLESFLIHVRVLDEFFRAGKHKDYPGDVRAADIIASFEPKTTPLERRLRKRIDQQLAHPTSVRLDRQPFPIRTMVHDVMQVVDLFLWELPAEQRTDAPMVASLINEVSDILSDHQIVDVDGS
jgi:hypothetical protein